MRILKAFVLVIVLFLGAPSWAQVLMQSDLDCRPSQLKKAEVKYQQTARPLLSTYAEQYSGRAGVLEEKEKKRAYLFREWLNMRCLCKPSGMSRFEKTVCRALTEKQLRRERNVCLVQN